MQNWWFMGLLAAGAGFILLLAGPLVCGRLFLPGMTLALVRRCGGWVARLLDRIRPGLDLELLVRAGNRYFAKAFAAAPFEERLLFLPFCLRPLDCPAEVDPAEGLLCRGGCPDCEVGRLRQEALDLGYARVYVVPSSRMLPGRDLAPSDQFIKSKLKEHAPKGALGVTCGWHLRHRLLPRHKVSRRGYQAGGRGSGSALQGVLLDGKNCRQARVDWGEVRLRLRQRLS